MRLKTEAPSLAGGETSTRMPRSRFVATSAALFVVTVLASCGDSDDETGGRTEVEFFQFKGEEVTTFDALVEQFEAENPEIDIVQNNVPNADAVLRTRLVKNDVPELMSLNGNGGTYGDLALAEVFRDFTGDQALENVSDASLEVLDGLGHV